MRFQTDPSSLPPMYGREPAGHSDTATGQAALTATIAAPPASSWRTRTAGRGGPATRYVAARAGTIIHPWSIFVMNASPTTAPHHARCFVRPDSSARTSSQAASTSRSTRSASGLLTRPTAIATGETASSAAAAMPAAGPSTRRTVAYSSATEVIAQSASGSSMLSDEKPNMRADRPMSQSDSGGLSTVMKLPGSSEPKNHAVQLSLADFTAAA